MSSWRHNTLNQKKCVLNCVQTPWVRTFSESGSIDETIAGEFQQKIRKRNKFIEWGIRFRLDQTAHTARGSKQVRGFNSRSGLTWLVLHRVLKGEVLCAPQGA